MTTSQSRSNKDSTNRPKVIESDQAFGHCAITPDLTHDIQVILTLYQIDGPIGRNKVRPGVGTDGQTRQPDKTARQDSQTRQLDKTTRQGQPEQDDQTGTAKQDRQDNPLQMRQSGTKQKL